MSLAYIFLAHRLPDQLGRLVSALHHPDDLFLVHIDAKVDRAPFAAALNERLEASSDVQYVPPIRCDWAGFGHLEATLEGIEQALAQPSSLTHVVLLTGQDYPIKPVGTIRSYLDGHRGRSFLSWSAGDPPSASFDRTGNLRWYWDGDLRRLQLRHYLVGGRWRGLPNRFLPFFPPRRKIPLGWRPYQGLAYWCLSIEAVRYARDLVATHPELIAFYRRAFVPDEFFFQMALLNSPLKETLANEDLRYMTWEGFHPAVIRSADLEELSRSPKLFARKFDSTVDAEILDLIDAKLL